jgi:hypothetical protein
MQRKLIIEGVSPYLLPSVLSIFISGCLKMKRIFSRYYSVRNFEPKTTKMKIAFTVCMTLIILSVSCKKSNEQTNTSPVVTDTVKPPVVKPDTSTLLKMCWTYNYDASGTVIIDSLHNQWTYDNQRRVVQVTSEAYGYTDTLTYTYLNDRYITSENSYSNGSLVLATNTVFYQHLKNHTDSILSTSAGYGIQAGYLPDGATYYSYNQANQDSVEKSYIIDHGAISYRSSLNYFYTGTNLDSTINLDNNGKLNDVRYFTDGNQTTDYWYNAGVQAGVEHFTYSNISSGGLYIIYRTSRLMSGYTSVSIPAGTTFTEVDTYQLDSANRVTAMLIYRNSSSLTQKQVFTYY